jgi:uncharacterized repeat protein (TIGR04138 family)
MTLYDPKLAEVASRDSRFAYESYEFVLDALAFTQKKLGREPREVPPDRKAEAVHHVSGRELLLGIRDFALREFGLMARTVFHMWGIESTDDFGDIVFNLVEANLMSTSSQDRRGDFHAVYDLDRALVQDLRVSFGEAD